MYVCDVDETRVVMNACTMYVRVYVCMYVCMYVFVGKVCLIQISTPAHNYIIDTLVLWNYINEYLHPIFQNPNILKLGFSISGCDVPGMYRDFGITIRRFIHYIWTYITYTLLELIQYLSRCSEHLSI